MLALLSGHVHLCTLPSKKLALLDLLASKPSNPVFSANAGRDDDFIASPKEKKRYLSFTAVL